MKDEQQQRTWECDEIPLLVELLAKENIRHQTNASRTHDLQLGLDYVQEESHQDAVNSEEKTNLPEATVTSAPARRSVSMMATVSISSDPFAIGTNTRFNT